MRRKRYTACYTLEDGNWLVELAEVPQVHTFGSTLAKARANIRDALGLWLQADDPERIDIAERFLDLPADLVDVVTEANGSRTQARALSLRAQDLTAQAARSLVRELGMSTRDAAELLHVSHQRIHQLIRDHVA